MSHRTRIASLATVAVAALVATGCGQSVEDAEARLCTDLAALKGDLAVLQGTDADTTIDDFNAARDQVKRSWNDVQNDIQDVADVKSDELEDAWKDLEKSLKDVDEDQTFAEASDEVREEVATFLKERKALTDGLDCGA